MERLRTGTAGLDAVLGGGLIADSITLLAGPPGSGKTVLAERCLFENATENRPGLYLSTVSEPLDKILRYGQSLSFFDVARIGSAVIYDDLGAPLVDDGLDAVSERINAMLKEYRPRVVVVDSFKALKAFAADEADFRRFLHELAGRFTALAVTTIWVGEYDADDAVDSPEFAVADAVITLTTRRSAERSTRYLSVAKLRGSPFLSGDHVYRITGDGLRVFPRLADPVENDGYAATAARISTGIPALDDCLEGGYWRGSTTLAVGPSGIGKTLMGLQFLFAGGRADEPGADEPGILLTLQEDRSQLARITAPFGWSIDRPGIQILDRSPVDVYLDELIYELLDRVDEIRARRVVVDSYTDLVRVSPDPTRLAELTYSLVRRCARRGISLMFTYETVELFGLSRISDRGISNISDNVLFLQYLADGTEMKRAIGVLKSRGTAPDIGLREFTISSAGIGLGEPVPAHRIHGL
jgi:circadian clock protein KaiC